MQADVWSERPDEVKRPLHPALHGGQASSSQANRSKTSSIQADYRRLKQTKTDHGRPKHSEVRGATSISDAFIVPSCLSTSSFPVDWHRCDTRLFAQVTINSCNWVEQSAQAPATNHSRLPNPCSLAHCNALQSIMILYYELDRKL